MPRQHLEHLRREATQYGGQNLKQSSLSVNVGFFPWLHHSVITRVLTSQLRKVTVWQYISLFFIIRLLCDCPELGFDHTECVIYPFLFLFSSYRDSEGERSPRGRLQENLSHLPHI